MDNARGTEDFTLLVTQEACNSAKVFLIVYLVVYLFGFHSSFKMFFKKQEFKSAITASVRAASLFTLSLVPYLHSAIGSSQSEAAKNELLTSQLPNCQVCVQSLCVKSHDRSIR